MAERTDDQLIDQMTYALASTYHHYGPGLNEDGLRALREDVVALFSRHRLWCDAGFYVDVCDDDEYADFHQRIVQPDGWHVFSFEEFVRALRGEAS